ncbi:MAG: DUF4175 domain-containing protein [Planctomycetes bacterium]|nr:DUF4175 domain-containing protein [Planctomycetota bacterium]
MSTATIPFTMPKPVSRKVRLLRWLVRLYVCLDGLAAIVLVLGAAFWLGLAIDWTFEPSPLVRGVLWGLTTLAATYAAVRYLWGPLVVKLSNTNLALLLERNFPVLNQSVITTVEAADRNRATPVGNERLLQNTSQEAATALYGLRLRQIFQFRPLLWKSGLALALLSSIGAFAALQTDAFGFWVQRMQLNNQPWPRQVELSVVGFMEVEGQRIVYVARDDDFELEVNASIREGHVDPELVEIRYRLEDGRRGRDSMTRIGVAVPGRDDGQLYRYQFKKVAADLKFDLVGGDARLRNLQLRVVERPQIFRMVLECEFPEYLGRTPQTIPVSGRVELPEGTQAICRIEANKPLQSVRVHDPAQQVDLPAKLEADNNQRVSFPVAIGQEDRVLLVTMLDQEGVGNREPYRIVLSSLLDQPPEVSVQLRGIGSAITPQAKIPFAGQVTDDYGLQAAWFAYQIDKGQNDKGQIDNGQLDKSPPAERALASQPRGGRELRDIGVFDLAATNPETQSPAVALKPGQQLTLSVKARDAYDLPNQGIEKQGHIGSSQRFMLEVVTNSELRALLEKKELALRQRFESIYEKMIGTRELLDRINTNAENSPERNRSRLSGALQNVVQISYETLGVADGFEAIVGELVNNRVDSEELTRRLQEGITDPLREIGGVLMPQLEKQLQELLTVVGEEEETYQKPLAMTKAQGDLVLDAMKQVLDRMLELESYNELVELLRGIVADHQKIQQETKQKRREKLRSLLED